MKKQDNKSFADLAKEIQNRYKRADFDSIEQADMEKELENLMLLQEQKRASMGLDTQDEMSYGGKMKYPEGGSILPSDFAINSSLGIMQQFPRSLPSNAEIGLEMGMAPYYRQNNRKMPLADLTGIEPGVTEVNVIAPGNSLKNTIPQGQFYNDTITGSLARMNPQRIDYKGLAYANQASNEAAKNDIINEMYYPSNSLVPVPDRLSAGYNPVDRDMSTIPYNNIPNFNIDYGYGTKSPSYIPGQARRQGDITRLNNSLKGNAVTPPTTKSSTSVNTNSTTGIPINSRRLSPSFEPLGTDLQAYAYDWNTPVEKQELIPMNTLSTNEIKKLQKQGKTKMGLRGTFNKIGNSEYLPYAISGLSNIAGNLLLANMAKKNQPTFSPVYATSEKINLEPQAEQLRKNASVAKNVALRNARNLGTNAGETLANMGVISAGVDRGLGENLTNLYLQQEGANVGAANQFNLANSEMQNRGNLVNTQLKSQTLQDRLGYMSGVWGTIPGVMKDIRMDKADAETRKIMDDYYKSLGGRNYMPVGSLFKSSDGRFTYKVKGYNADGTPITEKVK